VSVFGPEPGGCADEVSDAGVLGEGIEANGEWRMADGER